MILVPVRGVAVGRRRLPRPKAAAVFSVIGVPGSCAHMGGRGLAMSVAGIYRDRSCGDCLIG